MFCFRRLSQYGGFLNFDQLFHQATGCPAFPYQRRLAEADALPAALCAPTGAGKTAAAALGWLYRRRFAAPAIRAQTPRRLVFCLPMRTLVTQTAQAIEGWLDRLELRETGSELGRGNKVSVHTLLGGDPGDSWYLHPEQDAVLVGTQDMLLSRALGRGYGCSRFLWPWLNGLLANDCLWVLDEIQLMGPGLATGLQLAALRQKLGTFGPTHSLFMSATLEPAWLRTVDHPQPPPILRLGPEDFETPDLHARHQALKTLAQTRTVIQKNEKDYLGPLGDEVLAAHVPGSLTLVVCNTVERATRLFQSLQPRAEKKGVATKLLHSRFRRPDRDRILSEILGTTEARRQPPFSGILISTQVVEAGVDISARTLFTELAPWPSLVQRAGRCNRRGEYTENARVLWIDHASEQTASPYEAAELASAREHLRALPSPSFNPADIDRANVSLDPYEPTHVLRRRDLLDLFDTTPELGGVDIDISRFIRDGDDRDVQVFWRHIPEGLRAVQSRPARDELCPVPLRGLEEWLRKQKRAYVWDVIDKEWRRPERLVPGQIYLLHAEDGGYTPLLGWSPDSTSEVPRIEPPQDQALPEEGNDDDPLTALPPPRSDPQPEHWVPLRQHALDARAQAQQILAALDYLGPALRQTLLRAAQAHDLGKAHAAFQDTMWQGCPLPRSPDNEVLWAKSGTSARHKRRGLRHELASALAWLQTEPSPDRDLIAYLLAAHHGKVRLSLRALPGDDAPEDAARLHARGIWDGEALPATDLGEGLTTPPVQLSLRPMRLGRDPENGAPSWAERTAKLLDEHGPFRLAFLEALVRAADVRATIQEKEAAQRRRA
jgi:CRISPR-associated endonuclease/helicase Cas3